MTTDRIEKQVLLRAPRSRVWRALTDAAEFGTWFGVKLDGPFREGSTAQGRLTYPGYEHMTMAIDIARIEPESYFAYRWHPYAIDSTVDYSSETPTLVEFRLEEAEGGTRLSIVESGFDAIPAGRRDEAFRMNDGGWTQQTRNLASHVARE